MKHDMGAPDQLWDFALAELRKTDPGRKRPVDVLQGWMWVGYIQSTYGAPVPDFELLDERVRRVRLARLHTHPLSQLPEPERTWNDDPLMQVILKILGSQSEPVEPEPESQPEIDETESEAPEQSELFDPVLPEQIDETEPDAQFEPDETDEEIAAAVQITAWREARVRAATGQYPHETRRRHHLDDVNKVTSCNLITNGRRCRAKLDLGDDAWIVDVDPAPHAERLLSWMYCWPDCERARIRRNGHA